MIVMVLETVPVGLRGELTRWLLEPHTGVFVGHVNAMVRDRLWEKCCKQRGGAGGVLQACRPIPSSALKCACMAKPAAGS